ncbi:MAG: hypothetical protein ACC657_05550 [Thiohalomonadales bacterium]
MTKKEYNFIVKCLNKENKKYSKYLTLIDKSKWYKENAKVSPVKVWRSNRFMVQLFDCNPLRLSINRTMINQDEHWIDGITWDEIQTIKKQCGYENQCAIEFYPPAFDLVCDFNMRHIWILDKPLDFMWQKIRKE